MATHSSILAWRIPGTEEPGGLPSMGSHRVRHDWSDFAAAATYNQLCLTLQPHGCSLPVSSVHGILQARILEWIAIPFSRGSSWPRDQTWVFCTAGRFFAIWATRGALIAIILRVVKRKEHTRSCMDQALNTGFDQRTWARSFLVVSTGKAKQGEQV